MYLNDVATVPASLAGVPAMSLPAGSRTTHPALPVGLQVMAPLLRDDLIYRVAWALRAGPRVLADPGRRPTPWR
jgi:aspartyl-tRNA(Asn)/glutamyl-tRNA(Gln) amidotransferase subunit A